MYRASLLAEGRVDEFLWSSEQRQKKGPSRPAQTSVESLCFKVCNHWPFEGCLRDLPGDQS